MRMPKQEIKCRRDWEKIAREVVTKVVSLPVRAHRISPDFNDCDAFFMSITERDIISIDIETHPKSGITCVGFALNPYESFTVPVGMRRTIKTEKKAKKDAKATLAKWQKRVSDALYGEKKLDLTKLTKVQMKAVAKFTEEQKVTALMKRMIDEHSGVEPEVELDYSFITIGYWKTEEDAAHALSFIKAICETANQKVMQGGLYDTFWLKRYGIECNNYAWDTMAMHHCLEPNSEHSLQYMASVDTDEPYWKDESKGIDGVEKFAPTQSERGWIYNGKDCCVTHELMTIYYQRLVKRGLLDFYIAHYRDMQEPLIEIMQNGIPVDREGFNAKRAEIEIDFKAHMGKVTELSGKELYGAKKLSPKKLADYLYVDLGLPKQLRKRAGGDKTPSADFVAVKSLMLKFPEKIGEVGEHIIQANRLYKMIEQLNEKRIDEDDRFRSQYKFTTSTGRLASSKNPTGTGGNGQNVDRELRGVYGFRV